MVSVRWPTFGAVLRRQRHAAGLTQEQLAERAGLSPRAITALERGVSRAPRAETLRLLAEALNLSAAERTAFTAAAHGAGGGPDATLAAAGCVPARPLAALPSLVGRASEVASVEQLLAGAGPPFLLLAGEPGIGKSRLLREAAQIAPPAGWSVLAGGCTRRGAQEPYTPLLQALEGRLRGQSAARLRLELEGCAWLVRLLPELAESTLVPAPTWRLPPEQERRLLFAAVGRFLANVAGPAGTLLLLDDLQWAGADALDLLASLVQSELERPLRVMGAYRSTEVQVQHPLSSLVADLARAGLATKRALDPLSQSEAAHLLQRLLDEGVAAEGVATAAPEAAAMTADRGPRERVLARCGGVPYFLVSCAQALRTGALDADALGAEGPPPGEEAVPWGVAQTIRQRVAVLPPAAQELLAAAAVAGRVVPGALLAAVVAHSEDDVLAALEAAGQARLLTEEGEEDVYQFAHDLIREVVAASLSGRRRKVLHRRVAEALERQPGEAPVAALAYHYKQAGETIKAITYLRRAGDRAWAMHANAEAETYYREVVEQLERLGCGAEVAQARERLAEVLHIVAQYDAALDELEQALETYRTAGDQEGVARTMGLIGYTHARRGTPREGLTRILPLLETLPTSEISTHGLAMLHTRLAPIFNNGGRYPEGLAAAERAVELARSLEDTAMLTQASIPRGIALASLGRSAEALQVMEEVVPLADALGDLGSLARALLTLGIIQSERGAFASGWAYYERALTVCEQLGDVTLLVLVLCNCGENAYWSGEWEQARGYYERAAETLRRISASYAAVGPPLGLGLLDLAQGRWTEALRTLEDTSALARNGDRLDILQAAQNALAERDLLAGRVQEARAHLDSLVAPLEQPAVVLTPLLPLLAWVHLELGDTDRAHELVKQAIAGARAQESSVVLVDALRIQALLGARLTRWHEAAASLDEALTLARAMPSPYAEAKALYVHGQLHVAMGEPERARDGFEQALAILCRLGERLYATHVERALADLA
jgi:tetratricopeptide (TPR) repeat protein/transcriptional regulator with XRE-family HTH domain